MSSIIDSRIVEAKFENSDFITKIRSTLDALSSLQKGLQLSGATKGLTDIDAASKRMDLSRIGDGVDKIASKFNAMTAVATAAITRITFQAVEAGEKLVKSFTLDPITDGLSEYETQLNSIQTILANTQWQHKSLDDVNGALNELNHYSDKTIYNFTEMARNIGTFTAAGVGLDKSVASIKGIANLAAVSGSSALQASTAMYQLSQAISTGTVRLIDWNSVQNAGMGGKVFQDSLMETARVHGVAIDKMVKDAGSFRGSLEENWLTSKVLTETLSKFTGDLSRQQLKQMGYNQEQIDGIIKMGKTATDAATKVKTFTQLMGTLKESAGSGWAKSWSLILGNFGEAKKMWTSANDVLGNMLQASAKTRNAVLKDWNELGGRKVMIDAVSNAFHALLSVLAPIKDAFHEIFPAKTGQDLYTMTVAVRDFMENLKIGADTADLLKRSFAGVFAVFSIIGQVISAVVGGIKDLIGVMTGAGNASGGILNLSAGLGDFLVSLNETLKKSGALKSFFSGLASVLAIPLKLLVGLAEMIGGLFSGFDHHGAAQVSDAIDTVGNKLSPLASIGQRVTDIFKKIGEVLSNAGTIIADAMSHVGEAISSAITPQTFDKTLSVVNTSLIAGMALMLHNFFTKSAGAFKVDFGGGLIAGATETLKSTTGVLKSMQAQIKADTIMKIAIALGILTASLAVLAMIDGKKLAKAFVGISVGFAGLSVSLATLTKVVSLLGALKLPFITAALMGLGVALVLYAGALKILSTISFKDMAVAMSGLAGSLVAIAGAMHLMPNGVNMTAQAAGLVLIGVALNAIAVALKIFGTMEWGSMAKGLAAMAGSLVVIAGAVRLMPKTMVLQAAGLTVLGVALNVIATAMKIFGTMDYSATARALVAMAGALLVIAGAIEIMPVTMLAQAAGLLVVSIALNALAAAMKIFGTMKWDEIARAVVALGGSLLVLAIGLAAMGGTISGATALLIAAAALAIFVPVLVTLGNLDWGTIIKGLAALAAVFLVLGVAGLVLTPIAPALLAIGAALLMVGAGIALIGAGAFLFASAWTMIVASTSAGYKSLVQIQKMLVEMIPKVLVAVAKGIIEMAVTIAKGQVEITKAFISILTALVDAADKILPKVLALLVKLLDGLLDAVVHFAPKIAKAMLAWIDAILTVLVNAIPDIADAGMKILVGFINAITDNLQDVIDAGKHLIIAWIKGIGKASLEIVDAAARTLIQFLEGLADAIRLYEPQLIQAGIDIADAIVDGFWDGLKGGMGGLFGKVAGVFGGVVGVAYDVYDAHSPSRVFEKLGRFCAEGFAKGLIGGKDTVLSGLRVMKDGLKSTIQEIHSDVQTHRNDLRTLKQDHRDLEKAIRDDNEAVDDATKKLNELLNAKKQDHDAIVQARRDLRDATEARKEDNKSLNENEKAQKEANKALNQAEKEWAAVKAASEEYDKQLKKHKDELKELGIQYDEWTAKIEKATQALDDAIQKRNQYRDSITQQYSTLPDITADMTLDEYIANLTKQVEDTKTFIALVTQLRAMGLNDATYQQLLAEGVDALPFVQQLVDGGQAAVDTINGLTGELTDSATAFGKTASETMYQSGVDIARGILKGLKEERHKIREQMEDIADDIEKAIKKKLKIKSPSEVMADIGMYMMHGLGKGLKDSEDYVQKIMHGIGHRLVETMREYVNKAMDLATSVGDIAPVVNQSNGGGKKITTESPTLSVVTSTKTATNASAELSAARLAILSSISDPTVGETTQNVTFIQNNTSPKALSSAEIYRQTNNQLSRAKEGLAS